MDLAATLANDARAQPCLVDCLTLWLSNMMLAGRNIPNETEALIAALSKRAAPCIMVSNEVGLGIVPDNALGSCLSRRGRTTKSDTSPPPPSAFYSSPPGWR